MGQPISETDVSHLDEPRVFIHPGVNKGMLGMIEEWVIPHIAHHGEQ